MQPALFLKKQKRSPRITWIFCSYHFHWLYLQESCSLICVVFSRFNGKCRGIRMFMKWKAKTIYRSIYVSLILSFCLILLISINYSIYLSVYMSHSFSLSLSLLRPFLSLSLSLYIYIYIQVNWIVTSLWEREPLFHRWMPISWRPLIYKSENVTRCEINTLGQN